jgi:hypothetical protein
LRLSGLDSDLGEQQTFKALFSQPGVQPESDNDPIETVKIKAMFSKTSQGWI